MGAILVLAGVQTSLSPEQLTTYRVTDLFDTILGKGIGGICTSPVDIRKSFNGLLGTVRNTFDADSEDVTRGMDTNGRQFLWVSENIT